MPDMNRRDTRGFKVGNRSATKDGGSYLYGGTDFWSNKDALEYILVRFADRSADGGPTWTMGGQVSLLTHLWQVKQFQTTQTVADIIRQLIPINLGVDFKIVRTFTGFEIQVFSISAYSWSFGGKTTPRNPNQFSIRASQRRDIISARVVKSAEKQVDRIRILGRRVIVCCTLRARSDADDAAGMTRTLEHQWSADLEAEYLAGTGTEADAAAEHDKARRADHLRPVFRAFAAPADWDHNNGYAAPSVRPSGKLTTVHSPYYDEGYQNAIRSTLAWLPLKEGYDYSRWPPRNNNATDAEPDLLPPMAWLRDEEESRWVPADEAGFSISILRGDLGIFLSASPAHLFALNHWDGAAETATPPKYDYDNLAVTVAFESDQRLILESTHGGATGDGSIMEIEAPDCEMWYLAPETIVGVNANGALVVAEEDWSYLSASVGGSVLRDDSPYMQAMMAGAASRYFGKRYRAEVILKGLHPYHGLLGRVLSILEEGGNAYDFKGVITSVEWRTGDQPTTTVRTGYAH